MGRGAAPGAGEIPEGQGYPPPATRAPAEAQGYPPPVAPTVSTWTPDPFFTDEFLLPPPTNTAVPVLPESFDPQTYGLPETIAGYRVVAVYTSENQACMPPGQRLIYLESPHPTVKEFLDALNRGEAPDFRQALEDLGLNPAEWTTSIGGPVGTTLEEAMVGVQDWNRQAQLHGCTTTVPIATEVVTATP